MLWAEASRAPKRTARARSLLKEYISARGKLTRVGRGDLASRYILAIAVLKESEESKWNNNDENRNS
jgi:hypothetical protein